MTARSTSTSFFDRVAKAADRLGPILSEHPAMVRADAQRLPFTSASIDVVVCTESFHWYHDQASTLGGLAEILRPGGRCSSRRSRWSRGWATTWCGA